VDYEPLCGGILSFKLSSFIYNQIVWKEDLMFYGRVDASSILIQEDYQKLLDDPRNVVRIRKNQQIEIIDYEDIIQNHAREELMVIWIGFDKNNWLSA